MIFFLEMFGYLLNWKQKMTFNRPNHCKFMVMQKKKNSNKEAYIRPSAPQIKTNNLRSLTQLSLFENQISGSLPQEIANLNTFADFLLDCEQLVGLFIWNVPRWLSYWLLSSQQQFRRPNSAKLGKLQNLNKSTHRKCIWSLWCVPHFNIHWLKLQ